MRADPIGQMPWERWPLNEWHIIGMNHYFQGKGSSRQLYVAMRNDNLAISAEGAADGTFAAQVWAELSVRAVLARLPRVFVLTFDPKVEAKKDKDIKAIFADEPGGLIWCALRQNRLADQHFNGRIRTMLEYCREKMPPPSRTPYWDSTIKESFPRSVLGNSERVDVWAEVLHRIAFTQQGVWKWRVEGRPQS